MGGIAFPAHHLKRLVCERLQLLYSATCIGHCPCCTYCISSMFPISNLVLVKEELNLSESNTEQLHLPRHFVNGPIEIISL